MALNGTVIRTFELDDFFAANLSKLFAKQSHSRWFQIQWRHCSANNIFAYPSESNRVSHAWPKIIRINNYQRLYLFKPTFCHMLYCTGALQWRHNRGNGISNHQPHHSLVNRLFRCRSKKTSKLRVTGLWAGNSPVTGEFPAQMSSNAENISIWWRHHGSATANHKSILLWEGLVGLAETVMITQRLRWHLLVM